MSRREQNVAAQLAGRLHQTPGPNLGPKFSIGHGYVQESVVKLRLAYNDIMRVPPSELEQMRDRAELQVLSKYTDPHNGLFVHVVGVPAVVGQKNGEEDGWGWVMDLEEKSIIAARENDNGFWDLAVIVFGMRFGPPDVDPRRPYVSSLEEE